MASPEFAKPNEVPTSPDLITLSLVLNKFISHVLVNLNIVCESVCHAILWLVGVAGQGAQCVQPTEYICRIIKPSLEFEPSNSSPRPLILESSNTGLERTLLEASSLKYIIVSWTPTQPTLAS